jgi:tRNA (guanosine-2'-O-)-methyltransferase
MPTERRIARMRDVLERRQDDLAVVIENVHDPHNASAILRSADGFAAGSVHLLYTNESFPEISRAVAAYTDRWTRLERHDSVSECVDALRGEGLRIIATNVDEEARGYLEVDWTRPAALVVGNEHRGCSEELLEAADEHVLIPMAGFAQSFNVSVAAAVILAEAARQRLEAGMLEPAWSDAKQELLDHWIAREHSRELRQPLPGRD